MIKKAMVMAAGVGSRLDPLTKNTPKPLVPVANLPVMDILLHKLVKYGITGAIANTHYLGGQIQKRYEKCAPDGLDFRTLFEENLSGTAGGVKKCEFFFENEEDFLVLSGDGLHDAPLDKIMESHLKSGCIATMGVMPVAHEEVCHYGVVVSEGNIVAEFQEKPPVELAKSNLINTGIYVFKKRIFDFIPAGEKYDFTKNVFPSLMEAGEKIHTYQINNYWSDIGTLEQYRQSNFDAIDGKVSIPGFVPVKISNAACAVGKNCEIAPDAILKGRCVLGSNCKIGARAVVEDSILWNNVEIAPNCRIKNCMFAQNSIIDSDYENETGAFEKMAQTV